MSPTVVQTETDEVDPEVIQEIEQSAELLYGMIHARYLLTSRGLECMVGPQA